MTGGIKQGSGFHDTFEFMNTDTFEWESGGDELEFGVAGHCMVALETNKIMVIGGQNNSYTKNTTVSKNTYIITSDDLSISGIYLEVSILY